VELTLAADVMDAPTDLVACIKLRTADTAPRQRDAHPDSLNRTDPRPRRL
jgi:hypothetical protein